MKDFYKILGLKENSDKETIKKSFRKLAHKYHPDKYNGSSEIFKEIREAFEVLYDDNRRRAYDINRNIKPTSKETKKNKTKKKYMVLVENIKLEGIVTNILFKNGKFYIIKFDYYFEDELMNMVGVGIFFDELKKGDNIEIIGDIVYNEDYREENFRFKKTKKIKSKEEKEKEEKEREEKKEKEEIEINKLFEMLNEATKKERTLNLIKNYYYLKGFNYVLKNIKYSMRKVKGNKENDIYFYLAKSLEQGWAK